MPASNAAWDDSFVGEGDLGDPAVLESAHQELQPRQSLGRVHGDLVVIGGHDRPAGHLDRRGEVDGDRITAGNGKFPLVHVPFSKNHRPIPIAGATYYLRPTTRGNRTPIRMGKDVAAAHTAMINMDCGRPLERPAVPAVHPPTVVAGTVSRKTVEQAARECIERSKQKSRNTYLGYRTAVNLFVESCKKTYLTKSAVTGAACLPRAERRSICLASGDALPLAP